ncbi:Uncharacterised protein [Escherichia coli]|uniref:Uncharacterized protein n=1 Tax=Escherichia coli TaxID=562 RepID=A0A2X3K0W8_ECOLX|nr:Uncharacterised protein [Escherichia coli]
MRSTILPRRVYPGVVTQGFCAFYGRYAAVSAPGILRPDFALPMGQKNRPALLPSPVRCTGHYCDYCCEFFHVYYSL